MNEHIFVMIQLIYTFDLFIIIPFMTLNILQHGMRYAFNLAIQILFAFISVFFSSHIIENSVAKKTQKNEI